MGLSLSSFQNYCSVAQVAMRLLKSNSELVATNEKLVNLPIEFLCQDFSSNHSKHHLSFIDLHVKLSTIQLKLIGETIKMFPSNSYQASLIAKTFLGLKKYEQSVKVTGLTANLLQLSWTQFDFPNIFKMIQKPKIQVFHQHCLDVMELIITSKELLNDAMRPVESANFCVLFIQTSAPQIIHLDHESFKKSVIGCKMMILSSNLEVNNFRFIETKIIQFIAGNDFWLSLFCFHIYMELLVLEESMNTSEEILRERFDCFNTLLESKVSIGMTSISQLYIASIIQLIIKLQQRICNEENKDDLQIPSKKVCVESQHRFVCAFLSMKEQMTSDSYYELNISLKFLADCRTQQLTQETISTLCELIKLVGCDWELFSDLIIGIMNVVISTEDELSKLNLMNALFPALGSCKIRPMGVKLKLVDLLISYIPISESNKGLSQILTKEINKILANCNEDFSLKRVLMKKLSNPFFKKFAQTLNVIPELRLEISAKRKSNIVANAQYFKVFNECLKPKDWKDEEQSPVAEKLQLILAYSAKLRDKNLTENELEISRQIAVNFKEMSRKIPPRKIPQEMSQLDEC